MIHQEMMRCYQCSKTVYIFDEDVVPVCPNCGHDMNGYVQEMTLTEFLQL